MTRQKQRQWILPGLSAVFGFMITAIGALLGNLSGMEKSCMIVLGASSIVLCVIGIGAIAGYSVYTENSRQLRKIRSLESIPQLIRFKKRNDTVTIVDENTVRYNYFVTIETNKEEACTSFCLPIEFDLGFPKAEFSKSVVMKKLKINGVDKPFDSTICFRQLRESISHTNNPSALASSILPAVTPVGTAIYGLLEVPVPLGTGHTRCTVELEFDAIRAFSRMEKREFIYIDIPYVTESMVIKIVGSDTLNVRAVEGEHGEFVEATSYFLQRIDHGETLEEKKNLIEWQNGIRWETAYPKLGYRYIVWFQVHK